VPAGWRNEAGDDPEERRLAAAGAPHERHELVLGDLEIDRLEREDGRPRPRRKRLRDAVDADERGGCYRFGFWAGTATVEYRSVSGIGLVILKPLRTMLIVDATLFRSMYPMP
jgi:hypothetical protein